MPQANALDLFHGDNREQDIDFQSLFNNGILFVWLKASQGIKYRDPKFNARVQAALSVHGLGVGAYHFLDSNNARDQASNFLGAVKPYMPQLDLAADYEKLAPDLGGTAALHTLQDFCALLDPIAPDGTVVYSSDLIRETLTAPKGNTNSQMIGAGAFFQQHRLWLAEYGPGERVPWPWNTAIAGTDNKIPGAWMWQFSATGAEPPIVGNVDLNYINPTLIKVRH